MNAMAYEVTDGRRLGTEIGGLDHWTNYQVMVFGVDERGRPYKTLEVNATTRNSKNVNAILTLDKLFSSYIYKHLLFANVSLKKVTTKSVTRN